EDEVEIVGRVDQARRGRYPHEDDRFAAAVEQTVVGIWRQREHAAWAPLEGELLAVALPDLRRPPAFQDEQLFLVQMSLGLQGTAARDLCHVQAALRLERALQLDERALAVEPGPRCAWKLGDVFDADRRLMDRHAFASHEVVVRKG